MISGYEINGTGDIVERESGPEERYRGGNGFNGHGG